jgi:hypothetical protein
MPSSMLFGRLALPSVKTRKAILSQPPSGGRKGVLQHAKLTGSTGKKLYFAK